jgi:hypothetical protein
MEGYACSGTMAYLAYSHEYNLITAAILSLFNVVAAMSPKFALPLQE